MHPAPTFVFQTDTAGFLCDKAQKAEPTKRVCFASSASTENGLEAVSLHVAFGRGDRAG
jgi:hypothetical protein